MILSALSFFKQLLVPKGSFGSGPSSKLTEIVALVIISSLLSLGLYWALIFFFIFLKTGQLTNLSTTIAVYSKLEAPSMTICSLPHVSREDSIVEAYKNYRLNVVLIYKYSNKNYFSFNPVIRQCYWERKDPSNNEQCLCIDMWRQVFYGRRGRSVLRPPFFLFHRSTFSGFDMDSISVGIKYLRPSLLQGAASSSISDILKIGIYDQPMIVANQHSGSAEPSWFYSNMGNNAQVSLKLLKNYVLDVEKFYFHIFKGYVSRQENEYEMVVSQKKAGDPVPGGGSESRRVPFWIRAVNGNGLPSGPPGARRPPGLRGPGGPEPSREPRAASFTKFHVSFRDFSVTEVFRLSGASAITSFLTLTVVCLSAFNKQLIYELLFPYYEDRNVRYTITSFATFLTFGYIRKCSQD
ncbi:putative secreted protein, 1 or more transmembrane domain, signal peptide [Cryptosporidium felis]|nr:putative secreted protein, 1 or more transmembrane domain, signal peptide [Cryptosporidium felis]